MSSQPEPPLSSSLARPGAPSDAAAWPLESIEIAARGLRFPALACGRGPLVLCLHGFPDTHLSFRHQLRALAAAGYRAVAPALRGYHPSCMPATLAESNVLEAARDAVALVEALGESPAHLVGHDWGAIAAYLAAALAPQTWTSVVTMAVPHPLGLLDRLPRVPRQLARSWYMLFFQLPGVAERAVAARDFALLEQLWRSWSPGLSANSEDLRALKQAFAQPGVTAASLAYYRALFAFSSPSNREARRLLQQRLRPPVLALSGMDDGCIDTRTYESSVGRRYFSSVVVEQVGAVGHFMHLEDPARISARILAWLKAPSA
jgi:pimeloyl-ACP methyl ester carboxylesterase